MLLYDRARISQKNHWLNEDGYVYFVFPITEISLKWGKCCTSVKAAMKELDEYGLLIRSSGGFYKTKSFIYANPLYRVDLLNRM